MTAPWRVARTVRWSAASIYGIGLRPLWIITALILGAARGPSAGILPSAPFSETAAGATGAAFLKLPASARAEAMGGSFCAAVDSSESVFWNPAGLTRLGAAGRSDLSLSYNALLQSSYGGALAYARPAPGHGVFGAGIIYFSAGSISGYNALGDPTGSFSPSDISVLAAFGRSFKDFSLGAGFKIIRSQVNGVSGTTVALDLGIQAQNVSQMGEGPVDVGASIQHLGPALRLGGNSDPLPLKIQAGALWHISRALGGLFDVHMAVDQEPYASVGVEWLPLAGGTFKAGLRGGYNMSNTRGIDGLTGMSGGLGLDIRRFRLDYSWAPFGDLGAANRATLGFAF